MEVRPFSELRPCGRGVLFFPPSQFDASIPLTRWPNYTIAESHVGGLLAGVARDKARFRGSDQEAEGKRIPLVPRRFSELKYGSKIDERAPDVQRECAVR